MNTYRIVWVQSPPGYHSARAMLVEAGSEENAIIIARHHIESLYWIGCFILVEISLTEPLPPGRVITTT